MFILKGENWVICDPNHCWLLFLLSMRESQLSVQHFCWLVEKVVFHHKQTHSPVSNLQKIMLSSFVSHMNYAGYVCN